MKNENKSWEELRNITPEKMTIALSVLEEIRQGKKVIDAIRHYPRTEEHTSELQSRQSN